MALHNIVIRGILAEDHVISDVGIGFVGSVCKTVLSNSNVVFSIFSDRGNSQSSIAREALVW